MFQLAFIGAVMSKSFWKLKKSDRSVTLINTLPNAAKNSRPAFLVHRHCSYLHLQGSPVFQLCDVIHLNLPGMPHPALLQ
jgi:hypothetical protein